MQEEAKSKPNTALPQAAKASPKASAENTNASGRWTAAHRARLPHKAGLPLSSGGCGDAVNR